MRFRHFRLPILAVLIIASGFAGCSSTQQAGDSYAVARRAMLDTITAGRFDGGKMWTFDDPPVAYLKEAYGFQADKQWLDEARLASLRFSTGCSASFVSADGLVMTNHHCVRGAMAGVQKEGEKLLETGFYAARMEDERKLPGVSLDQLTDIRDVTADIIAAMETASSDTAKVSARQRAITAIERRNSDDAAGLRAQVVTLYQGGKYALYLYRRYSDVRLVFAPELQAAHFGREYDNFTYPRYAMDCSFIRVYGKDGTSLASEHFFRWSADGAAEHELVFVIGNPGRTNRLSTADQLEYSRDIDHPFRVQLLNERMAAMQEYVRQHPAKKDELLTGMLGIANSQKAITGQLAGLRDDVLVQRRRAFDRQFRAAVMARPDLEAKYGRVWNDIAESRATLRENIADIQGLRVGGLGVSEYVARAYALYQYATEMAKPEAERREMFRGSMAARSRDALLHFTPIDAGLDELFLARQLGQMRSRLGSDDPLVTMALAGESEARAAHRLITASALNDSVAYMALLADPSAVLASADPFLAFMRAAAPRIERAAALTRAIGARDQVNASLLGRALYDVYGTSIPPDATFTIRIADGVVKGYDYNGTIAPPVTTFYGLYDRHYSFPNSDWDLAPSWRNPPASFPLKTPMNFSSTNDIIGGNSGSPMINTRREIVGLIFDGNIESLPGSFIFAEDLGNRTVSVHSSGIREALRHIYKAERLVNELQTSKASR